LISPYEADGQLAYLSHTRRVDGVVTEDSDLICLGIDRLIYKLGGWNGDNSANRPRPSEEGFVLYGTLLSRKDYGAALHIDLLDFSNVMLVVMFVSAGCDYCDSLRGIGIVTARDVVEKAFLTSSSEEPVLQRVLTELYQKCHREARERLLPLNDATKDVARNAYEKAFLGAIAMYRHPLVYDPVLGDVIANDVSANENDANSSEGGQKALVSRQFLKEEQILMEYEPYRRLVTDREALYQVVGTPRPLDLAHKITRGLVDENGIDITATSGNSPAEALKANNHSLDTQEEVDLHQPPPTHGAASSFNNNNNLQPSSQEFTVLDTSAATQPSTQEFSQMGGGGRGTQQSKSSSDKTLSSLSPDLLASPSPTKRRM
jgi:5'-3' exonuclease